MPAGGGVGLVGGDDRERPQVVKTRVPGQALMQVGFFPTMSSHALPGEQRLLFTHLRTHRRPQPGVNMLVAPVNERALRNIGRPRPGNLSRTSAAVELAQFSA